MSLVTEEEVFIRRLTVDAFNLQHRLNLDPDIFVVNSVVPVNDSIIAYDIREDSTRENNKRLRVFFRVDNRDYVHPYQLETDQTPMYRGKSVFVAVGSIDIKRIQGLRYLFPWDSANNSGIPAIEREDGSLLLREDRSYILLEQNVNPF